MKQLQKYINKKKYKNFYYFYDNKEKNLPNKDLSNAYFFQPNNSFLIII